MNIAENLQRIQQAKSDIKDAIIEKGVYVDDSLTIDNFADKILEIEGGGGGEDYLAQRLNNTLTSYNIPNSVTSIPIYAFYSNTALESIRIPNSVTSIGGNAFQNCSNLTSITIPNSVTSIGGNAFQNCSNLTSITIPNSVTSIGTSAFTSCSTLTSINIPNSVKTIGNGAFSYCNNLTSATIGNSVTSIGNNTFTGCTKLNTVNSNTVGECIIPNNVKNIGDNAFCYCPFTSITIPTSVVSAGSWTFSTDYKLKEIKSYNYFPMTIGANTFRNASTNGVLHVPIGASSYYSTWMSTSNYYLGSYGWSIVDDLEYTPKNRLICKYNVTTTSSGTRIKYDNASLSANTAWINEETTPRRLTTSAYTFSQTGENTIKFDDVDTISSTLFRGITRLTSIEIPNNITTISSGCCSGCTNLNSVTIGSGVTSIGSYAFARCSNLTSITIPNSVTSIGEHTFDSCTNLNSVTIGSGVTSIGEGAFISCNVYDLVYADGCKETLYIGSTTQITSVTIPNSVTSIGSSSFFMSKITSVTIPNSVTSIGRMAFYDCSKLNTINYNDTTAQWNAISKDSGWKSAVPSTCIVHCTDGDIPISEA